ncbi:methyl-accepting chemotaxis protein [Pyxidicoccus sp. MSG2]|uniref:methyl-accepting chemotaxis protein n=1 Tax=Pyxidicoccus sp. MSG2 TaxID=2996790 RepID=UPI00226EB744|nr:methyl-accepting chemotaxis protein [Pyxidicoccus sp. MSG2]MCY1019009.1 methyl-accepting chemotaxis protein [Pyxidicoccus sp. MSG2]
MKLRLRSVGWKLLLPTFALLTALLGGQGVYLVHGMREMNETALEHRGQAMADLLANIGRDSVSYYNLRNLDLLTTQVTRAPEVVFAAFHDESGKLLTQQESPPTEPVANAALLRYERALQDADGRPLGTLRMYFTREAIEQSTRRGLVLVLGCVLATLVAAGLGIALLIRHLLRPVRELTRVAEEVVSTGDLRQDIRVDSVDEIGRLSAAFAEMIAKMREALSNLQTSSRRLDESATQLTAATHDQGETLSRQASALQQTHTTANEIQQTSTLAAQKARDVLEVMEHADQASREGASAVDNGIQRLGEIREQVEQMTGRITRLSERTRQIATITGTVKDLADQSNMLALNAAIEAARSGEHGKGFGVVAREIRSLADQSIQATQRVRDVLDDISAAIHEAVGMNASGMLRIETGLAEVRVTGDSLRQLSGIVKESTVAARQISAVVSQQGAGVHQTFLALGELQKMMDESMARLESTRRAASVVSEVSRAAARVVEQYQVQ